MSLDALIAEAVERGVARALAERLSTPAPQQDGDDQVMDAADLQAYLGIGRNHAYGLLHAAPFPVRRIGHRLVTTKRAVRLWLEGREPGPDPIPFADLHGPGLRPRLASGED